MEEKRIDQNVKRAALYIRVSSEEQAMHGLSLQAQREALTKYAEHNQLKVFDIYADEGITARKKYRNRAQFMRMLDDAQNGNIDVILFIKLDRWFRNIADYYEVQRILDSCNVQWIATEERYDTTTANGRLNLNIRLSIAQDESDRTSERIKFVFENKVQRNEVVSGKVPLGYKIENKRLVIDDEKAEIVRDIFNQYINTRSFRSLRTYVMEKYGLVYTQTGLRYLTENRRYIGEAHGQPGFCEPIISKEIFDVANNIARERAERTNLTRTGRQYLFVGKVFCAECGNRLSAHTVSGKYIYYRCSRYEKLHLCKHKKRTSEIFLEKWLLDNIESQFAIYNKTIMAERATKTQTVDVGKIKKKMDKLKDLYLNDLIDRDIYERDYTALREALDAVESQGPEPAEVDLSGIASAIDAYRTFDRAERKAFWSSAVKKIIITDKDEISVIPY